MRPLTGRQKQVLRFVVNRIEELGYPPTLREIGKHFGIKSTNGVNDHLHALERKGWINRAELHSRGIRLTDKTKQTFGKSVQDDSMALADIKELIEKFPESVDLSTAVTPLHGADNVIRRIKSLIQGRFVGCSLPMERSDSQ